MKPCSQKHLALLRLSSGKEEISETLQDYEYSPSHHNNEDPNASILYIFLIIYLHSNCGLRVTGTLEHMKINKETGYV
ncbi:hypothetical protein C0J52_00299 [Blattella germanica]|nr:hypothetical protein C0J52_00299 [Blattella germanica]